MRNNIFVWEGGFEDETLHLSEGSNVYISHCDFWHIENWYKIFPDGGELLDEGGIIQADPLFRNEPKGDFRLQAYSPCIDAGHPTSSNNDTDNSRNDMGAFGGPYPIDPYLPMHMSKLVSILPCSGFPGDTVSTFLSVQKPAGVARADFILSFDHSVLSLQGVSTTPSTSGFDLNESKINDGMVQLNIQGASEIESEDDQILKFDFIVNHQAVSGNACALEIQQIRLQDSAGNNYSIKTLRNGTFIVNYGNDQGRYIFVNKNYLGIVPEGYRFGCDQDNPDS
jgi:hypothetical protein